MAEMDTAMAGFHSGKMFGEATMTKEESKQVSPASEDTRESAASSADAKGEDSAETIREAEEQLCLPGWIREKKYPISSEEADKQLWEDLRKEDEKTGGSFLDQQFTKYIFIDAETRKAYVKLPTSFHDRVVSDLIDFIENKSEPNPVLAKNLCGMDLTTESRKHPDVFIFGPDRTENRTKYGKTSLKVRTHGTEKMNPHAIIEVSWTTKVKDELEKFALEINKCNSCVELGGAVNVGYLIKFIPLSGNNFPTKKNPKRPLVGIDIYRMEAGDRKPAPGDTFVRWRHGEAYPGNLEITREELGQGIGGEGVSIPFGLLVDALDDIGVVFQSPDQN